MKLTIEHLAAYLTYGLKVKTDSLGIFKVNGYRTIPSGKISILTNDTHVGFLQEIQLVLRPLSELTKEHVKEIYELDSVNIELIDICEWGEEICHMVKNNQPLQLRQFNILFKYHYDVFGLIESGLAIDINELNNKNGK